MKQYYYYFIDLNINYIKPIKNNLLNTNCIFHSIIIIIIIIFIFYSRLNYSTQIILSIYLKIKTYSLPNQIILSISKP
jgi:hypothetical protein